MTALQTTARPEPSLAKVLWIQNTLRCGTLLASEAYLDEARRRPDLKPQGQPAPLDFDERGDLKPVFGD